MKIEALSWDSHFFKLNIGKVDASALTQTDILELKNAKSAGSFDLIYIFLDTPYSGENLDLYDKKITYTKPVNELIECYRNGVTEYKGPLTEELERLTLASGHLSRFKKDQRLSAHYEQLYKIWILKSLAPESTSTTLIHRDVISGKINGFVTVENHGTFGQYSLMAVNEMDRGKGIAKKLFYSGEYWYRKSGLSLCQVVTQADNVIASNLYENLGYEVKSIKYIYHL